MIGKLLEEGRCTLKEKGIDFDGRAETSASAIKARDYMDRLSVEIRMIDAKPADTGAVFFGRRFAAPIMSAALSGLNGVWPDSLTEIAKAAAKANLPTWIGIGDASEMRAVLDTGAATVKIVKPYRDKDLIFEKLKAAEEEGAFAVGMDTIFGFGGKKGDVLIRPELMEPVSSQELSGYISATKLPFIVKGVLSVSDAVKAVDAGAACIVVSSHSGSVIDHAVPPLQVLPQIAKALNGAATIFIDGSFERGVDVYKALALGADGVLLGRAVIKALAVGGAQSVETLLSGIAEELRRVMSVIGAPTIPDIDPSTVYLE